MEQVGYRPHRVGILIAGLGASGQCTKIAYIFMGKMENPLSKFTFYTMDFAHRFRFVTLKLNNGHPHVFIYAYQAPKSLFQAIRGMIR